MKVGLAFVVVIVSFSIYKLHYVLEGIEVSIGPKHNKTFEVKIKYIIKERFGLIHK